MRDGEQRDRQQERRARQQARYKANRLARLAGLPPPHPTEGTVKHSRKSCESCERPFSAATEAVVRCRCCRKKIWSEITIWDPCLGIDRRDEPQFKDLPRRAPFGSTAEDRQFARDLREDD